MMNKESNEKTDVEMFIFGEPIKTKFGNARFLTYKEYLESMSQLSAMSFNTLHIYYQYRKFFEKKNEEAMKILEELKEQSIYEIVLGTEELLEAYRFIFTLVLGDEGMSGQIFGAEEDFLYMRRLILDMQMITEEEVSPNPEIQKGIEMSKKVKQSNADKQSFTDVVTSIVAATNNSFADVCSMTVYQIYSIFYRIGAIKAYDTTTLFATVSEDVKIESWSKHINLFEETSSGIDRKTFDEKYGKLLS